MAQPRVGDLVGRYRLESVVGRGGMGVVYRATDTVLRREVALKVMGGVADDDTFRERFAQEAAALARLDSPHVVAIHDHGEHRTADDVADGLPGAPYLVTQLVAGGDLGTYLAEHGALPPTSAAALVAQVAGALRDAHAAGVVHRDVKPANVLLRDAAAVRTDDLHVYLCDFGIAQAGTAGLTTTGLVAGTWKYLAPERARGRPATPASDVYAAGCLLWACLTGHAPYDGSDVEVAIAHQQEPVPQLGWGDGGTDDLGDGLDRILRRALAKDPDDRYDAAADLRADLLALPRAAVGRAARPTPVDADGPRTEARHPSHPSHPSARLPSGPDAAAPTAPAARDGSTEPGPARSSPRTRRRGPLVALLAVLLAVGVGSGLALAVQPDDDTGDTGDTGDAGGEDGAAQPDGAGSRAAQGGAGGTRTGAGASPRDTPVTGDVDGDGLGDLALSGVTGTGTVFSTYPGTGSGVGSPTDATGIDTRNVPLRGDLDGDGTEEYVGITSTTSGALVLQPVGGGESWLVAGAGFEVPPVVGDLDGDGTDDLALLGYPGGGGFDVPGQTGGEIRVALGGDGARAAEAGLSGPFDPVADLLVPADLDGDGDDDLALLRPQGVRGGTPGSLTLTPVLADDGDLTLGEESGPFLRLAGTFARPADVDGDGRDEVALVPNTGGEQVVAFGLGPDGALAATDPWGTVGGSAGPRTVRAVGVSDLDGDGRDDLTLVRAVASGGPVTGVDVLAGGTGTTSPYVALADRGLLTAKLADGSVSRPFGVDR